MKTKNTTTIFGLAHKLHTLGFSVIPSGGGDKGKAPIVNWTEFQNHQATESDIENWQAELKPRLWGIVTNDHLAVVDADTPETRAQLEAELGEPHVITPRGGAHWYIETTGYPMKTVAGLLPGIDVRGVGGFVNIAGGKYQILRLPVPGDTLIPWARLPERILAALDGNKPAPKSKQGTPIPQGLPIPITKRNATLISLAGTMRRRGMTQTEIEAALLTINRERCQPPLPDDEVIGIAVSGSRYRPKSKETEDEVKETSFLTLDHTLYEQIISDGQAAFIEYDTTSGESRTVTQVLQGDVKIIPLSGEEIALGAVKLPSGIAEYRDTLTLLKEIETHINRYLDISDSFRKFAAYYILLSWLYDRFNTLPYLRFIGDTGCGKSRALDVCGGLCYKATSASGCITPAPIYRMIKRWQGTIILDEADLQNSDEYHEVTKILNCGFERNRPVIRAVKDNPDRLQILPTFGPKVFATRRRFKDAALEARCLTEIMQETVRDDISATLTSKFYKEQQVLQDKLLLFRLRNYNHINLEDTAILDLHGIEPRLRQISACFATLFAGQPDVLSDYRAFIQNHQRELIEQRAATTIGQVVEKLFSLMESVTNVTNVTNDTTLIPVSSGDIAGVLNMTPQAVGQILKTLGLQTSLHKVEGSPKRCIIFDQVKLNTLRKRYIPCEDDEPVTRVTMVTTPWDSINNVTETNKGRGEQC